MSCPAAPLKFDVGDWMVTVPLGPRSDEALTRLAGSARNRGVTKVMFPPAPPTAFAVTSLPCKITTFGSMKIFPPLPSAPSTEVLTVLSTNWIRSMARMAMLPPFACEDSVVVVIAEPLCSSSRWPALIEMLPALPAVAPVLLADMTPPLLTEIDFQAVREILPPKPEPSVSAKIPLPLPSISIEPFDP